MKEKATLKQISKELGVSVSTVSKALNDSPEISEATKIRIQEFATHQTNQTKGSWTYDTQSLQAGVYIVVFKNALGFQTQHKLIKQ